jgi:hypothetical protein
MDKQINSTHCIDFLEVTLDSTLSWQGHITKVSTMLNSACFAIRTLKLFLSTEDLRMVHLLMFTLLLHIVFAFGEMLLIATMFL